MIRHRNLALAGMLAMLVPLAHSERRRFRREPNPYAFNIDPAIFTQRGRVYERSRNGIRRLQASPWPRQSAS
jgi:hypothetical protein